MKIRSTLLATAAALLLVAPTAALADRDDHGNQNWNNGQQPNGQYQRHDRGDRHDRDHHDRGRHNGWNNPNNPHNGQWNNNGYNRGQYGQYGQNGNRLGGVVSSFSPYNLYLQNGLHVELHQGTVINPTGATPQPGQRVQIIGHWNADRTFAADQINLY